MNTKFSPEYFKFLQKSYIKFLTVNPSLTRNQESHVYQNVQNGILANQNSARQLFIFSKTEQQNSYTTLPNSNLLLD